MLLPLKVAHFKHQQVLSGDILCSALLCACVRVCVSSEETFHPVVVLPCCILLAALHLQPPPPTHLHDSHFRPDYLHRYRGYYRSRLIDVATGALIVIPTDGGRRSQSAVSLAVITSLPKF